MNNLAFAFSSSAMAFVVGVGTMPQTSTIEPPFDSYQQVNVPSAIAAEQTASSNVEMEIMVMRLIGVDNYRRLQEISHLTEGWDGYSAQPIPQEVISRTKELLMLFFQSLNSDFFTSLGFDNTLYDETTSQFLKGRIIQEIENINRKYSVIYPQFLFDFSELDFSSKEDFAYTFLFEFKNLQITD